MSMAINARALCPANARLSVANNLRRTTGVLGAPSRVAIRSRSRLTVANYQVTFIDDQGNKLQGECGKEEFILDVADRLGVDIPCVCRSGTCGSCATKLLAGDVDMSQVLNMIPGLDTIFSDAEIEMGLIPTCSTRPTSDVTVEWSAAGLK